MAEPRRTPARAPGRPPSDSLLRPTGRRLSQVPADAAVTPGRTEPAASRGWPLAVTFSAVVWIGLLALVLWLT